MTTEYTVRRIETDQDKAELIEIATEQPEKIEHWDQGRVADSLYPWGVFVKLCNGGDQLVQPHVSFESAEADACEANSDEIDRAFDVREYRRATSVGPRTEDLDMIWRCLEAYAEDCASGPDYVAERVEIGAAWQRIKRATSADWLRTFEATIFASNGNIEAKVQRQYDMMAAHQADIVPECDLRELCYELFAQASRVTVNEIITD